MNLREKLKALQKAYVEPEPYVHKQETVEELFAKVVTRCEEWAARGGGFLNFHWDYVYTNDREEWNKQHKICLEVVRLLKKEGLKAACRNKFIEPYMNYYNEMEYPDSHHFIEIGWDSCSWFPYADGEEE